MEFKAIFVITTLLLSGSVEVQSNLVSISSHWRQESDDINRLCGGNLIKISTNSPPSNNATTRLQAECNGRFTNDSRTRFKVVTTGRDERCIQFTSKNNEKYALKVINANNIVFEKQDCTTASSEFLFKQYRTSGFFAYEHSVNGSFLTCLCNGRDGLYLINPSQPAREDRKIRFRSIP